MSNTPSNAEAWDLWLESITGGHHPASLAKFAHAVLAKWGTPPAVAGEPVAWLSTDCIGERYLCFTKPKDSNPARPLVFGDTTPQPTQAQAGAVPLTDEQLAEMMRETWGCASIAPRHAIGFARAIERAHGIGIKGGQHGTE